MLQVTAAALNEINEELKLIEPDDVMEPFIRLRMGIG